MRQLPGGLLHPMSGSKSEGWNTFGAAAGAKLRGSQTFWASSRTAASPLAAVALFALPLV